ncbi:FecR family protein [Nodosilinea sp. E11]|uniref:FecR family protein n=1 Tax=Nodosilinea sp. E11 TaxID=3037479 RepID=UPI00293420C7|nr:FecR family protein [Nodosilinea sp. E11]WOD39358.1 FecR family protein [Nodosilinea sp. E11]
MVNVSKFARRSQGRVVSGAVGLVSLIATALLGLPAQASVPLTRAEVAALRNRVELLPRGRTARPARMADLLAAGDALRTAPASQADLRFNDGSLARVGERATFRFVPNTRNFRLTNGTVLLLIPPGQGRTNIQTPSAVTGIQGSAVVVRYIPERDLTLVMALTNNPTGPMTITASGCGAGGDETCTSREYSLYGGQMALIQNNQVQVVEFDLPQFYQTSPLVDGLELDNPNAESPLGPALERVREETLEALAEQAPFSEGITLNPAFIGMDTSSAIASEQPWLLAPTEAGEASLSPIGSAIAPGDALLPFSGQGQGVIGNIPPMEGNRGDILTPIGNTGIGIGGSNGIGIGVGGTSNGIGIGVGGTSNGIGIGVGGTGNGNGNGGIGNGIGIGVGGTGNGNGLGLEEQAEPLLDQVEPLLEQTPFVSTEL